VKPGPLAETARLVDLLPTALATLGVPSAVERDGQALPSLVGADVRLEVAAGGGGAGSDTDSETGLTSHEEGEIEEQLRGLGYVE
jgi:arylsulfatase A-like enzyme